ncbi:MAG: DUF4430 domain-containing protein [Anaerovoracaceae bacterium]|jgi:hypothetical protein
MRKPKKTVVVFLAAVLCASALTLASCGQRKDAGESAQRVSSPQEITISIDFPDSSKNDDVTDESIRVEKGSTAYDAAQLYCYVENIDLYGNLTKGRITGIGDIMNGRGGSRNSWQLYVNGELQEGNDSDVRVKKGDSLEWKYNVVKKKSSKKSK